MSVMSSINLPCGNTAASACASTSWSSSKALLSEVSVITCTQTTQTHHTNYHFILPLCLLLWWVRERRWGASTHTYLLAHAIALTKYHTHYKLTTLSEELWPSLENTQLAPSPWVNTFIRGAIPWFMWPSMPRSCGPPSGTFSALCRVVWVGRGVG